MLIRCRWLAVMGLAAVLAGTADSVAHAQAPAGIPRQNVISANPFGLLLELFNAEYERVAGRNSTWGIGGSTFRGGGDRYLNADAFWRYYPQKDVRPPAGWAFGVKAGITQTGGKSYTGVGFDVNRSWLLGEQDNFYVGVGFGLKRLLGTKDATFDLRFVPTFRLVNVGIAF